MELAEDNTRSLVEGKRLLVLGGDADTVSLVERAMALGCEVIVADYYTDPVLSPCKEIANEAWDISWNDIDALYEASKNAKINGVLAGYSEPRIQATIDLCSRLGLPCYSTMEQLEITRDKVKFKNACRKAAVPVVREYSTIEDVDSYPVIVKPVDRGGSIGIGIAHDRDELEEIYANASDASFCGEVIIEEYIQDGMKVDFYYDVIDGKIVFLGGSDVIFASDNGTERVVQSAWIAPSRFEEKYVKEIDPAMRRFIDEVGIKNGYLFVSGFIREDGSFVFFECGFRLCGGHLYNYFEGCGFPNTLDVFILTALNGTAAPLGNNAARKKDVKCLDLNFYAKEGTVAEINGFEQVRECPDCVVSVRHAHGGQICSEDKAILSKLGLVGFAAQSPALLAKDAEDAYKSISVIGENGEDMIYDRIDPALVANWWENS